MRGGRIVRKGQSSEGVVAGPLTRGLKFCAAEGYTDTISYIQIASSLKEYREMVYNITSSMMWGGKPKGRR